MIELSAQGAPEGFEAGRGPLGKIGEGTILDLAVVAEGFAEKEGGRGVAVGDGGNIHDFCISRSSSHIKTNIHNT